MLRSSEYPVIHRAWFSQKIIRLKKDNVGTVLMVEVGYKYKFFGDDARVNSFTLEFTTSSDVGCLDRSQRIRYGSF